MYLCLLSLLRPKQPLAVGSKKGNKDGKDERKVGQHENQLKERELPDRNERAGQASYKTHGCCSGRNRRDRKGMLDGIRQHMSLVRVHVAAVRIHHAQPFLHGVLRGRNSG